MTTGLAGALFAPTTWMAGDYGSQRIVDDGRLGSLVNVLSDSRYRLGLEEVEPDILGRAYEYLLRMFAEGQGKSGGEQFTPTQIGIVMARILDPQPGNSVYDPCCGSGGLLIKWHLRLLEKKGQKSNGRLKLPKTVAPLKLFGQEIEGSTYAIARMNAVLHDMEAEIRLGDTMHRPAFTNDDCRSSSLCDNPRNQRFYPRQTQIAQIVADVFIDPNFQERQSCP